MPVKGMLARIQPNPIGSKQNGLVFLSDSKCHQDAADKDHYGVAQCEMCETLKQLRDELR